MTNKWTQTDGCRDTPMFSGSDFLAIKNPEIYTAEFQLLDIYSDA